MKRTLPEGTLVVLDFTAGTPGRRLVIEGYSTSRVLNRAVRLLFLARRRLPAASALTSAVRGNADSREYPPGDFRRQRLSCARGRGVSVLQAEVTLAKGDQSPLGLDDVHG